MIFAGSQPWVEFNISTQQGQPVAKAYRVHSIWLVSDGIGKRS
jgi:hypothetical protein